ncbi:type I secretion protein [Pseudomonas chlororaphis]|uniref:beta strand repeat-containing protein n=1 Tax=Pseudomonas chlororaphis TaxID=587753 RepID=UPI000F471613|nr:VCBS domain-containing protein [Pseudomonas chlororaphis]ROL75322.1 type I secretion protein [Pseudomonas chlororaphis]
MATTTTTSGDTATSFSNTPQAQDDIFTTGVIGTSSATITEDLLGVVYLDVMSNDLGGNAKTLWSLDNATSLSTATKVYAPADLLIQDTSRVEATSSDTSFNGAKIWITSDGKVGYDAATLSTAFKAQLQALAAGASLTDSFTYAIRLGNGTLSWATAQVQFAGANDSVTMSLGAQAGTVTEDAATTPSPADSHSATGTIAFSDVDLSDTHTASFVAAQGNAAALGNFVLASVAEAADTANGTLNWTYTLDNAAAQALAQGQTASETYVVTISDGHGSSTTQNVTITITGTNDQVQITSGVQTGDAKEDSGDYAASGSITFTDTDLIDTHNVTVTPGASGYLGSFTTDPLNDSTGTGSGSLGWHFAVDNAALQFLGEGQTVTQTYDVAIGDGAVQTVSIAITGTNDRPTLTIADTAGAMNEGNAAATLSDSGALSFADLDNIDAVTVSHTANGDIAWSGGTLNAGVASALVAGFSVDQNSWDYSSSQNLDFLGAGETITFSYTVVATDDSDAANAASATQTVSITITGSNDAPVLSFASGNDVGVVQEDTTLSISGQFSSTDIDHTATATWSIAGSNTGTYGSIAVNSTGQWTYTLANGTDGVASAVQSLKTGESHDEVFSVQVSDGLGGVDTQLVTVTVTGSNDAPVLSFATGNDLGAVQEDTTLSVSGQFSSTDIDHTATATWSIAGSNTGTYGSIAVNSTGQWTYTLANGTDGVASAVQSLKAGESHDEVFSVQVSDGLGGVDIQLVTVTVTGTNDAAVLSSASVTLSETNAPLTTGGSLTVSDIDSPESFQVQIDTAGSYGKFSIGTGGAWTYTADSAHNEFAAGTTYTDTFAVSSADGTLTSVIVHILGTNDAAVLSADIANLTETNAAIDISTTGTLTISDVDSAATFVAQTNTAGSYGQFSIGTGGAWTYVADTAHNEFAASTTYTDTFAVSSADGTLTSVTVHIAGSNDLPTITSNGGGTTASISVAENTAAVTTVAATDVDLPAQTLSYSIVGGADAAKFSIVSGTGALSFISAPNFEAPADSGTNNVYDVIVRASDGTLFDDQAIAVTVTGVNDNSPVITSNGGGTTASVNVAENTTAVTTVMATDADLPTQTLSYSILNTAGTDFGKFSISSSGVLTFNSAPDYENAQDVGGTDGDNAYVVDVQVADGNGGTDTQTITVNVQNVVETPVDSVAPTVTVTGTALGSSIGSTSTVTFQFSETVSGFNLSDVSVTTTSGTPRGTFSNFTQVDGDTYTATLTRTLGGSIKVDVAANSYTDLAGNPGAAGSSANLPAGVAGEPINLALDIPLAEINGPVTVAISGVPAGWVLNAGTDNGDGTWTVQTNDPGALTVTTPSDFAGALVLDVNLYWSNSDGSTASAYVFNNVEVYAPGSPIFALSADDNLTGSSGADTFVFAQPIGNNQIYNFDVTADKIDLIGFTGITAFADLSISNDVNGNALVSIGSGQTVTLRGVDAADLSEANFQFDRGPLTQNTGTLTIADGAIMPFGGSIHNSGTIELGSAGNETRLEILFRGATLTGGGQVLLSDNAQNVIFGGSADTVLTNVDNRISGAGQLGAGQMILANAGLILASGLNSLVLDTGSHTITNSGVLESTGTGGMTVASTVENTGHLWANGGDLHLLADVTGNGSATIDGDASLTFAGAAHTSVAFHGEGAGSLVIAQAEAAGSLVGILGLESDDLLTFGDLAFSANTQLSYTANASGAGGLLTVDDGAHRAEVNLLGHYSAEDFQVTDGGEAGTQVSFHGESSGTLVGSMLADTLSGGDGNDIIVGRGGEDTLSGGAGADVFAYLNANEGGDHILDYNYAEGDTLDLSTLLNANFVSGTSQVADFVQLAQSGSDITVQVDPDGANNGKQFVDVAVLDHAGTPSPDLVRTWFGEADHTLTA